MRNKVHSIAYVILFLLIEPARAQNPAQNTCLAAQGFHSVDLRSCFPPIRNQDDIGWCYAWGAADQITCWAVTNKIAGISTSNDNYASAVAAALDGNTQERAIGLGKLDAHRVRTDAIANERTRLQQDLASATDEFWSKLSKTVLKSRELFRNYREYRRLLSIRLQEHGPRAERHTEDRASLEKTILGQAIDEPALKELVGRIYRNRAELDELGKEEKYVFVEEEGGAAGTLMKMMIDYGFCLESDVSSLDHGASQTPASSIQLGEIINNRFKSYVNHPRFIDACYTAKGLHEVFKMADVDYIAMALGKVREADPIVEMMHSCVRFFLPKDKRPEVGTELIDAKASFDKINQLLESGVPVGIYYNPHIFDYRDDDAMERALEKDNEKEKDKEKDTDKEKEKPKRYVHYSVLVGKRFNCETGHTEYVLRNSNGDYQCEYERVRFRKTDSESDPDSVESKRIDHRYHRCARDCETADDPQKCSRDCTDAYHREILAQEDPPFSCDQGYFVVDEAQLRKGILRYTYAK